LANYTGTAPKLPIHGRMRLDRWLPAYKTGRDEDKSIRIRTKGTALVRCRGRNHAETGQGTGRREPPRPRVVRMAEPQENANVKGCEVGSVGEDGVRVMGKCARKTIDTEVIR